MKFKNIVLLIIASTLLCAVTSCTVTNETPEPLEEKPPVKKEAPKLPPLNKNELRLMKLMGGELTPKQNIKMGDIIIHRREKEVSFSGAVNYLYMDEEYGVELAITTDKSAKLYEALIYTEIVPLRLQLALILIGAKNGAIKETKQLPQGDVIMIDVQPENGKRVPIENWMKNAATKRNKKRTGWVFVGSNFKDGKCIANKKGNIANINSAGESSILEDYPDKENEEGVYGMNSKNMPKVDLSKAKTLKKGEFLMPVRIFMRVKK